MPKDKDGTTWDELQTAVLMIGELVTIRDKYAMSHEPQKEIIGKLDDHILHLTNAIEFEPIQD